MNRQQYEEMMLEEFGRFSGDEGRGMHIRAGVILQFYGRNDANPLLPSQDFQDFIMMHGWELSDKSFLDYICIRPCVKEVAFCG